MSPPHQRKGARKILIIVDFFTFMAGQIFKVKHKIKELYSNSGNVSNISNKNLLDATNDLPKILIVVVE